MPRDNYMRFERFFRDPVVGEGVLSVGDKGLACTNIRIALRGLGYRLELGDKYDDKLSETILSLQKKENHINKDGLFGPGTRRLLTQVLFLRLRDRGFEGMSMPESKLTPPVVFLSYSWKDAETVNKIDQWLRDRDVVVRRDNRDFEPGKQLPEAIADALVESDKVLVVYSGNSRDRDWPRFERNLAEQHEQSGKKDFLIYLVLDDTPLPKTDPKRIAVPAKGRKLQDVGLDLLRGIFGTKTEPPKYPYKEDDIL